MKRYEEMTEQEQEVFLESIEVNTDGDPYVYTPTFEIFECAVKCMGWADADTFLGNFSVTFGEICKYKWMTIGESLYVETHEEA